MKRNIYITLATILLIFISYILLFNMSLTDITTLDNIEFSEEGFIDANTLNDTEYLVASNETFNLYLDETTSHFTIENKITDTIWRSNPENDDSSSITKSAQDKQYSTLEITYFNEVGSKATINNYEMSINHPESVLYDEGLRTYQIKYIDGGFQVLYEIKDVDIDYLYFPKYISDEVLDTLENRSYVERLAYEGYNEELGMYEIIQYEDMSNLVRKYLYPIFYGEDGLGYTREQAIAENAEYGYTETFEHVSFQVAMEVKLTDNGVQTSIINDSISETEKGKISTISLLPHFGTAHQTHDGYLVVPDGSGAVIEFNNGKSNQEPYSKRLYGDDVGLLDSVMPEVQQDILLPLYGMVKDGAGFAAIITKGDTMTTINADVSGRIDSYNKIYPTFHLREVENVTIGGGFQKYNVDLWLDDYVKTDFTVEYSFLEDEDASYVGMAQTYRDYLEREFDFTPSDLTTETVLTTEFLGSYDVTDFVLGVPYERKDALTTFEQSEEILQYLIDQGITDINVIYKGMINGGLAPSMSTKFDVENKLGGNRGYNDFLEFTNDNGIVVYPEASVMTTRTYSKMFDEFRYSSKRIDGSISYLYNYFAPIKLPYSEVSDYSGTVYENDYVINPQFYPEIVRRFVSDYDQDTISFSYLGGTLGGSYGDTIIYKEYAKNIQMEVLSMTQEDVILHSPYGFALPYTSTAVDVPMESSLYAILDYQVPLLQFVLSGYIDYSSESLNLSDARTYQYNFLKLIETGSNVKFTLSYDDSIELKETEFNYYYSTQYENWTEKITTTVNELNQLGIHEGQLVNHEQVQDNVVDVTYSTGLTIRINYGLTAVTIEGVTCESMDYVVLEVQ